MIFHTRKVRKFETTSQTSQFDLRPPILKVVRYIFYKKNFCFVLMIQKRVFCVLYGWDLAFLGLAHLSPGVGSTNCRLLDRLHTHPHNSTRCRKWVSSNLMTQIVTKQIIMNTIISTAHLPEEILTDNEIHSHDSTKCRK